VIFIFLDREEKQQGQPGFGNNRESEVCNVVADLSFFLAFSLMIKAFGRAMWYVVMMLCSMKWCLWFEIKDVHAGWVDLLQTSYGVVELG
jgi:hypothetical protein